MFIFRLKSIIIRLSAKSHAQLYFLTYRVTGSLLLELRICIKRGSRLALSAISAPKLNDLIMMMTMMMLSEYERIRDVSLITSDEGRVRSLNVISNNLRHYPILQNDDMRKLRI